MDWVLTMLVLYVCIFVHEMAHYAVAKMFKVRVKSVLFGFPKIFSVPVGDEKFSLGLIPLAGGMFPDEADWRNLSAWKVVLIVLAGPLTSFLLGTLLLLLLGTSLKTLFGVFPMMFEALFDKDTWKITQEVNIASGVTAFNSFHQGNLVYLLGAMGMFSYILSLFNLLPIPPLDGGKALFAVLERLLGRYVITKKIIVNDAPLSYVSLVRFSLQVFFLAYIGYSLAAEVWFLIF